MNNKGSNKKGKNIPDSKITAPGELISRDELINAFKSFEIASKNLSENYRNLEEEIKDLKENLNTVLESLPLGVIITNESEKIKFINKFLAELLSEHKPASFLDRNIKEFMEHFINEPDAWDPIKPIFNPVEKNMRVNADRVIPVFIYTKSIYGNNKKLSGKIFIIQDIEEIRKFKRLAELGEMSAKIAHEIRNPLGSIDLFASILYKELKNESHKEIVSNIISAVKNMNTAIINTLEFSKPVNPRFSKSGIKGIINKSLIFASYILKQKNINVINNINGDIFLNVDENLIGRSILNIIINASQAVKEDGSGLIAISIGKTEKKQDDEASFLKIDIEDNGPGIPENILSEVFTPFFSSKKTGGTGLGLSIALNNVILHGGYITAKNSADYKGAKISIFLPLMA